MFILVAEGGSGWNSVCNAALLSGFSKAVS
jgi:hypothetical protein